MRPIALLLCVVCASCGSMTQEEADAWERAFNSINNSMQQYNEQQRQNNYMLQQQQQQTKRPVNCQTHVVGNIATTTCN